MTLQGLSLIGNQSAAPGDTSFHAVNPANGMALDPPAHSASEAEVETACTLASQAFPVYRSLPHENRAAFLRGIADEIEGLGDDLTERFVQESGLPAGRAEGERGRTCNQLRLFASEIESPDWNRPCMEQGQPDRQPLPKPDTRLRFVPVGPVAVFGPANFPLAFSVAGGDTASALAAGCPVVCKAHPSHPGVSELIGRAILRAAKSTGMPEGVFSLIFDNGIERGIQLVQNPRIQAVGFTGSEKAGRALMDLAAARPRPIPVLAEMSSINPMLFLNSALSVEDNRIAERLAGSLTLGAGQFCTNPGLLLVEVGLESEAFQRELIAILEKQGPATMLNQGICTAYNAGTASTSDLDGVETLLFPTSSDASGSHATPAVFRTTADVFEANPFLQDEIFGPATLIVVCKNSQEMKSLVESLGGQLTVTLHGTPEELSEWAPHLEPLTGRIIFNGYPTGVEVCETMVHGGPYPASSDARFTSVGTRAIDRWLRPVCYQGFPESALPKELRA